MMVVGEGFEPSKAVPADLQSAPFGHSGTPPRGIAHFGFRQKRRQWRQLFEIDGGGGRIRTFEGSAGRFTICSLWPLGNPTTGYCSFWLSPEKMSVATAFRNRWWWGKDSNLRRQCRQIYNLLPLATREPHHGVLLILAFARKDVSGDSFSK
ncbi:hypothetical protein SKA34_19469 [Photobacterium sp. SKA34]|nr:hypothetical protein SKA34_19469 [Photobacterium sp. SKA34]